MIKPAFFKSSVVYMTGGTLPVISSILLLPFYTNHLSPRVFLQFSFYLSVSLFVQVFYSFSLDMYFGIRYARTEQENKWAVSGVVYQTGQWTWMWGVFWTIVFLLSGPFIFRIIFPDALDMDFGHWAVLSVLTGFFNAGIRNALQVLMYQKKSFRHLCLNVANFFLTLFLGIGGIYLWPDSLRGPLWGRFLSAGLVFLLSQPVFFSEKKFFKLLDGWNDMIDFCVPYFLFSLASWFLLQADRYILQYYLPEQDLNAYDVLQKCYFGMEFFQNTMSSVLFPIIFGIWADKGVKSSEETNRYFHVFTAITILILPLFQMLIPMIYTLFIQKEYFFVAINYMGLLGCWYAFRPLCNYYLSAFLFSGKIFPLMGVYMLSSFLQLSGVFFFAPTFGINAALFAGILSRLLQCVGMDFMLRWFGIRFQYNPFKMLGMPALFVLLNIFLYILVPRFQYSICFLTEAIFLVLVYLLYRNEIKITFLRYRELILKKFMR